MVDENKKERGVTIILLNCKILTPSSCLVLVSATPKRSIKVENLNGLYLLTKQLMHRLVPLENFWLLLLSE
jgi:hypothetical protein